MNRVLLTFFLVWFIPRSLVAQEISEATADNLPHVNAGAKQKWGSYLKGKPNKSYAIAENGSWAWVEGKASEEAARAEAVERCEKFTFPCFTFAVNERIVWDKDLVATPLAVLVTARLKASQIDGFVGREDSTSIFVKPSDSLGSNYHSMTPPSIPGGTTISTKQLKDLILTEPGLSIIDVRQGQQLASIPGAVLLPGAGLQETHNRDLQFAEILAGAVPNKEAPLVFFCLSYECWLSYNAALRAIRLGYLKVYWYRGGIDAWKAAKLPVVRVKGLAEIK